MTASLRSAKLAKSTAVHVGFAVVAMGGWAAFANLGHPIARLAIAAAVQGPLSGSITVVLKRTLEAMGAALPLRLTWFVPPLVTCIGVLAILVGAHLAAGTPEIARTIAMPYAVSSTYAWVYAYSLYAERKAAT